ncbi:MAG: histidine--tRNA ligase [Bacteroidetes bacterium HGW-Bacteroidetes-21]|nr:MAG: histidine--tRNA ligase [Bacteroidetes bacterium HGW-Bacteroidetes-21]
MGVNVTIPKGTRDFLPLQMVKRNYIFEILRDVFQLYGYQQIETPSMENLGTLLGKYGEEGDKLLFRILNSGDFLSGVDENDLNNKNIATLASKFCEKGLRYDLTVPFARFVVMYKNELTFPFKRFQIQPVWRADRPQKGRYREFYQCDVDVIGSDSLLNEFELLKIIDEVFIRLKLKVTVKLNNRKILTGLAEYIGYPDKLVPITVAMDKIDKAGKDSVCNELRSTGISDDAINRLFDLIDISKGLSPEQLIEKMSDKNMPDAFLQGLNEMAELYAYVAVSGVAANISFDMSLARGLSYYTGTILEVVSDEVAMGSICGGGRYDDLTGIFGLPGLSGVGMSFGAERIYDVLTALNRFPVESPSKTKVLVTCFGGETVPFAIEMADLLRKNGVPTEMYPDTKAKMKKQFSYADNNVIPWVIIIGEDEVKTGKAGLKNLQTGEQVVLSPVEIINLLKKNLT